MNPPSSQTALRRVIVLLLILLGVIIYSTGWRITGISLEETQDSTRQGSLRRALEELFSPDLFDQTSDEETAFANFTKGCSDGLETEQPAETDGPYVVISPPCGDRGDIVTVEGFNFHPDSLARVFVVRPTGNRQPFNISGEEESVEDAIFDIGHDGTFNINVIVPNMRGADGEVNAIEVEAQWATSAPFPSETTREVIVKIIETIFLALMATTIAIPISVVLSFTAARNLMRQIRLPLGETLVGFILLPIGFLFGWLLLGQLGELGITLLNRFESPIIGMLLAIGLPILAFYVFGLVSGYANRIELTTVGAIRLRGIILNILMLAAVIFALGSLGSLLIWLGTLLKSGNFYQIPLGEIMEIKSSDLGQVAFTLGELGQLTISLVAGLAGAFLFSSIGTSISSGLFKTIRGTQAQVIGAVLGVIGGAILMAMAMAVGSLVPLLMFIPPVAAAALGVPVVTMIYDRLVKNPNAKPKSPDDVDPFENAIRAVIILVSGIVIFVLTAHYFEVLAIVARERIPQLAAWQTWNLFGTELVISEFVAKAALVGAVLGGIGAGMAGTHALFPLGMVVYNTSRTTLNALRSIEPLIMGIVFVIWVSAGPFAGVLALGLHSIASLGKLYSEQIESIDQGPIEAIQATGANRLQTIIYAVVPQIVPPYIAFTMYRWDINVRMSTIIGFVGGGGIGFLLQQQINLLRYKQAGVAVLAIAIVVSILDYASASIRERII